MILIPGLFPSQVLRIFTEIIFYLIFNQGYP